MNYAYTPYIWPSVFTVILLIALAVYSGRRRSVPGATPFMIACLFAAAWAAGSVMEYAAVDLATKISWVKFQPACSLPLVIAITCFILEYAWPGRWLTRRVLALLAFTWLLEIGLILTNDLHHWVWRDFSFDGSVLPRFGPGGWLVIAYGIGVLGILNLAVLGWLFLHASQHRWPVALMLTGQIGGRLLFLLDRANLLHSVLPLDLLGMAFEFLMYAIALFGFRILDPITLARRTVIAQMHEGMLVLDTQGRVAGMNPAAAAILSLPESRLHGRPIRELLPSYTDPQDGGVSETDISQGSGPETRYYQLETSSLNDWRGLEVGRLLLLHDVTGQKQAQARLLEQQRALSILAERERLARELHDDLGQVLAFISTQGHVVQELLVRGEVATAGSYVARLIEAADEADTDIRESILSLRSPFSSQGLIPALQDYLRRYEQRYGLCIEVLLPEHGLESAFEPVAEVQIMRILQEGLANARKHAEAQCVQVAFTLLDGRIQIAMRDDGRGFEPGKLQDDRPRGFGMQFMRERAEAIGGSLEVRSAPGEGTEIVLIVPLKETHA
jgi:signal transduction histidine kinase